MILRKNPALIKRDCKGTNFFLSRKFFLRKFEEKTADFFKRAYYQD